ncbi:MAG: hypothetical protein QM680_06715 [Luteolibacter sp.]
MPIFSLGTPRHPLKLKPMTNNGESWDHSKSLARAILRDRTQRRKWLANALFLALGQMALGLWIVDGWLQASPLRFLIWWGICGLLTCVIMIFALYDMLAVVREEREKIQDNDEE